MWEHEIGHDGDLLTYQSGPPHPKHPGWRERLENLKWARDNCDGLFRVSGGRSGIQPSRPPKSRTVSPMMS
jgi:hypothetical protein